MKTRELTPDEIKINITEREIASIPFSEYRSVLADTTALNAIAAALSVNGKRANLFVCGPPGTGRLQAVIEAAEAAASIQRPDSRTVLAAVPLKDSPLRPFVFRLPYGQYQLLEDLCSRDLPDIPESLKPLLPRGLYEELARGKPSGIVPITGSGSGSGVPVVIENNPTPDSLFGTAGNSIGSITAGSVHRAYGGVLILHASDLDEEEDGWLRLKRAVRTGRAPVCSTVYRDASGSGLILPETEMQVKIVIIGTENQYDQFFDTDEDFRNFFTYFAEFDTTVQFAPASLKDTVNRLRTHASDAGTILSDAACLELVKHSIALSEHKEKLSTCMYDLCGIITEASAGLAPETAISADSIKHTIAVQAERFSLLEKTILEDLESGAINLKVCGSETGKVNGLAVLDKGPYEFGTPGLISARVAPGENGLVNIEHEAGLSGEIHDKWVLILEGYLRSRFARNFPLSMFASICFEQSYSEIDGDSASSSELYALLSAIAEVPLRQDIAVTGSLSQTGEIQAVGGLKEKIEGFYKTCRILGYTGKQGVIVPEKNIKNIILSDELLDEIGNGRFHIYPVSTVDDSMEILTGMSAGKRNARGAFPAGSFNGTVEKKLLKLAEKAKNFGS